MVEGKTTDPRAHLMVDSSGGENADRAFQTNHLLNALPRVGKPVVPIRTTDESFGVPVAHVLSSRSSFSCQRRRSGVRSAKQSAMSSLRVGGLSLASRTESPSSRLTCAHNPRWVSRRVQAKNAPFHGGRRQERRPFTALVVLVLHRAMPEHPSRAHFITTELMDGVGPFARSTPRFAITSPMAMSGFSLGGRPGGWVGLHTGGCRFPALTRKRRGSHQVACQHSWLTRCRRSSDKAYGFA